MNSKLNVKFSSVKKAAGVALNRTKQITGKPQDNSVDIYQKLRPEQFDIIAKVYGEDGLERYIKHMEAKRMRGK